MYLFFTVTTQEVVVIFHLVVNLYETNIGNYLSNVPRAVFHKIYMYTMVNLKTFSQVKKNYFCTIVSLDNQLVMIFTCFSRQNFILQ